MAESRRDLLRKGAVVAAGAWVVPTVVGVPVAAAQSASLACAPASGVWPVTAVRGTGDRRWRFVPSYVATCAGDGCTVATPDPIRPANWEGTPWGWSDVVGATMLGPVAVAFLPDRPISLGLELPSGCGTPASARMTSVLVVECSDGSTATCTNVVDLTWTPGPPGNECLGGAWTVDLVQLC